MFARRLLAPILLFAPTLLFLGSPQARADSSLCDAVAGNLIQNCGFEVGPGGVVNDLPTDWTVTHSNNSIYQSNYSPYVNSGSQSLIMGGGTVSQSFADTAGDLLTFDFYLLNDGYPTGNNGPNEFQAFFDSTSGTPLLQIVNSDGPGSYTEYSYQTNATGSDSISFTDSTNNDDFLLDDVSVVETASSTPPAVTPEPSSLILLGTAVLGLAGTVRRRMLSLS